jgi:hypothetical protein
MQGRCDRAEKQIEGCQRRQGPDGTLGFLTRFCVRRDPRQLRLRVKSSDNDDSWDVNDEVPCSVSSLSIIAITSASTVLASMAASMWIKTESSNSICHSSALRSPYTILPDKSGFPCTPSRIFSFSTSLGTFVRIALR